MKKLILFILLVAFAKVACANVVGYWTTVDDETNKAKSVVRVYEYQGKLYARVVALLKNKEANLGRNQTWLPNTEFNSEEVFIPKKTRLK